MNDSQKLDCLRAVIETDDDDSVLLLYLEQAKDAILNRMYHYQTDEEYASRTVPARYEHVQIEVAAYLLNKRGAEGEIQHIENGIHRNYKAASIPEDMLKDVMPLVGIPR